ncbi:MAG: HEAT repeat domain-containing protein [Bryobacteraceae bacterium]
MKPTRLKRANSDIPPGDAEISGLLDCLQSLVDGQSAIEELAACGPRAIPPLREFLLSGRIASVPQPRMWAVEALARLGARDVLIEYLQAPGRVADPQLQFAEDAVRNTAGRRLGAWRDTGTFEVLLDFSRKRNLPGVIETLADFERAEAIPCLDRALEDGMCRIAAEDGLRRLGPAARNALVFSAVTPLPSAEEETPSSLCRRRSVLGLLSEIGVEPRHWVELRPLLAERDPELVARAARIASSAANAQDRVSAAESLVRVLGHLPWYVWKDAEEALAALAPQSLAAIDTELIRRSSKPPLVRARDEVLRTLLRLNATLRKFQ